MLTPTILIENTSVNDVELKIKYLLLKTSIRHLLMDKETSASLPIEVNITGKKEFQLIPNRKKPKREILLRMDFSMIFRLLTVKIITIDIRHIGNTLIDLLNMYLKALYSPQNT